MDPIHPARSPAPPAPAAAPRIDAAPSPTDSVAAGTPPSLTVNWKKAAAVLLQSSGGATVEKVWTVDNGVVGPGRQGCETK